MTIRVVLHRAGISLVRRIAVLLVLVLVVSGCDRDAPLLAVKAVAAGVPSLAPFFDEGQKLGQDAEVRSQPVHGSLQQGDTPGLYGGTKQPTICDVQRLKEFLTDPGNERKARAWAGVFNITTAEIPGFLDRLTPVLLRHDTLVKNHDYKKEKAVPFDSLLQAGIAVLVDEQGIPTVKCSCGNPLLPFEGDTSRISVEFDNGNKKWRGYERASVVAVRPAARQLDRIALVDVDEPDRGISRPVGTTGEKDSAFDTRERRAVPNLAGETFGQASQKLADKGLAVGYDAKRPPPHDARVTASDPPAGTELRFGEYVTLSVADGTSGGATPPTTTPAATPPASGSSGPTRSPSTPPPSASGSPSSKPSSGPPASSSRPASTPPAGSAPPPSSPAPPTPSSPPQSSGAPPASAPATSEPPATTSAPATSEPASTAPATSAPATGEPATTAPAQTTQSAQPTQPTATT
ncbi:DUF6777 domain-containing protein [Streptomyces sp. HUAS ZL42]|uniref:DUF6777 domain-containing protein n=1 Tax=Streptomyces sp. HUAS ZL42 TaxID=3231715 RepID=UPI00345E9018